MAEATATRVAVFVEPTPNPNSLKFITGREIIAHGSYEFSSAKEAADSPLAARLFGIKGVEGVFVGRDFVTVRKQPDVSWDSVEPNAISVIEDEVSGGGALVTERKAESSEGITGPEGAIRRILDEEIRPAVASDGGDVVFQKFENGILSLRLVGSCSGCPSSLLTLKMGIERRLKEDVPELMEIISVA